MFERKPKYNRELKGRGGVLEGSPGRIRLLGTPNPQQASRVVLVVSGTQLYGDGPRSLKPEKCHNCKMLGPIVSSFDTIPISICTKVKVA